MACAYGSRLASSSLVDDEFDQLVLNKHIEGTADTVGTLTCSQELALAENQENHTLQAEINGMKIEMSELIPQIK